MDPSTIFIIVISLISGLFGYCIGRRKQRTLAGTIMGLFLGPVGLSVLNLMPAPISTKSQEKHDDENRNNILRDLTIKYWQGVAVEKEYGSLMIQHDISIEELKEEAESLKYAENLGFSMLGWPK